jgi:hypothetical protein
MPIADALALVGGHSRFDRHGQSTLRICFCADSSHIERGVKPRRIDSVTRIALVVLSRFFHWRDALVVVRPETMIRWHRAGWKLFWRLKSRPGRPPIPLKIQALIRPDGERECLVGRGAHRQ